MKKNGIGNIIAPEGVRPVEAEPEFLDGSCCANCVYYAVQPGVTDAPGQCRRYPPTTIPLPSQDRLTGQQGVTLNAASPPVARGYGCGEFMEHPDYLKRLEAYEQEDFKPDQ